MKDNRTSPFLSDLSKGVRTLSGSMKNSGNANPATPAAVSYGRFNKFSDSSSLTGRLLPDFSTSEKSFTVLEGIPNELGKTTPATGSIGDFDIYGTKIYSDMTLLDGTKFRTITAQRGFRLPLYRDSSNNATERVFVGRDFTDLWPESAAIDEVGITFMLKFLVRQTPNEKALLSVGTGNGSAEVAFNIAFDSAGQNIIASHKASTAPDSSVTFNISSHYDKFLTMFASVSSTPSATPRVQNVAIYETATGDLIHGLSSNSGATGTFKSLEKPRLYIGYGEADGGTNNAFDYTSFLKNVDIAEVAVYKGALSAQEQDVIVRSTLAEVPYKSGLNNRAPRRTQQILDAKTAYPNSAIPESKPATTAAFNDTATHIYGTGSVGGEKQSLMFPEMLPANMFSGSLESRGALGDTRKFYRDVHHTPFDKRLVAQGVIRPSLPHQETELLNLASRNSPATISQDTVTLGGSVQPFHDDNPILDLVSRRAVSAGTFPDLDQRLGDHVAIIIELNPSQDSTVGVERDAAGVSTGRVTSMAYFNFSTNKWETAGKNNDFVIPGAIAIPTGSMTDSLADKYRTVAANTATALYSSASVGFAGTSGFTIFQNTGADSLSSLSLRGAPTSNYGFPTANKYEAKDNQLINMGDYIDAPFILERVQFQFGAAIEESGPHSLGYRQDAPSSDLGPGEKQFQSPMMELSAATGDVYPDQGDIAYKRRYLGRGDFINGSDIWNVDDGDHQPFDGSTLGETFSASKAGAVASLIMGKGDSTRADTSLRRQGAPKAVINPVFKFHPGEKTEAGYSAPIFGSLKRNSRLFLPTVLGPRETYQSLTTRLTPPTPSNPYGAPISYIPVVAGGLNGVVTGSLSTNLEAGPLVLVRHDVNGPRPEGINPEWGEKGMESGVPFWRADTFFLLRQSKASSVAKEYNFKIAFGRESLMMPVAPYAAIDPGNVFHAQNVSAKNRSRLFSKFDAGEFNTTILSNCATSRDLVTYGQMTHYGFAAAADSYMDTIWDTPTLDSGFASGSFTAGATGHDPVFKSEIFDGTDAVSLPLFGQAIKFAHQIDFANIVFPSNPANLDKNTSMLSDAPDTFQGQYSFFAGEGSHINNDVGLPGFKSAGGSGTTDAEASRRVNPHDARYYAAGMNTTSGYNPTGYERLLSLDTWMATPFAGEANPVTSFLSSSAWFVNPGIKSNAYQANVAGSGFSIITTPAWPTQQPGKFTRGAIVYTGYESYPEFNDYGTFDRRPETTGRRASLGDAPVENWLQAGLGKEVNYYVSASSKHEGINPDYPDSWAGFTLMTASTAWRPFSSPGRESAAIGLQANVYKRQYLDYRKKIELDVPVKSTLPLPIEAPGYWVTTSENERSPTSVRSENPLPASPTYPDSDEAILMIPEPGDPTGAGAEGVTGPAYRRARSAKRFHQRNTSVIKDSGFSAGTNADNMSSSRNFIRSTGAALPTSVKAVSAIPYGVNRFHRGGGSGDDLGWSENGTIDNLISFSTLDKKSPKKSSQESLYVLKPDDKLILGVQPALPGWNPGSGLPNNRHASKYGIWDYSGSISNNTAMTHDLAADGATMRDGLMNMEDPYEPSHGLTMLAGPSRVVLYGTLMKDNKHKPSNSTQVINSSAVHEALHYDNPVLDQFLTDGAGEYSGNTLGQIVDGKMSGVSALIGDARRVIGDIGTGDLTFSGSFQRFTRSSEDSQVFYDTLLQDPFELATASGGQSNRGSAPGSSFIGLNTIIHLHMPPGADVLSHTLDYFDNAYSGDRPNFAFSETWADSFPFENKYSSVSRVIDRDGSKFSVAGENLWISLRSPALSPRLSIISPRSYSASGDKVRGTLGFQFLSGSLDTLWDGVSFDATRSRLQGFGWQVAGISNMANTSNTLIDGTVVEEVDSYSVAGGPFVPSSAPFERGLARLLSCADVSEKIKSFRTLFASIVGFGRQNRKQLDYAYPNSGIIIIEQQSSAQKNYGRSLRFHPAGFKYGYMNCDHLSPSMVHRGDRYGQFRDMLEQRLYGKTYNFGDEFNKRGEAESAVSCIFVDADGSPIDDSTKTQCLNLSTAMTSSKPFIEGEVMREIIFSSESVTIE